MPLWDLIKEGLSQTRGVETNIQTAPSLGIRPHTYLIELPALGELLGPNARHDVKSVNKKQRVF